MFKYVAIAIPSLALFATPASSQKTTSMNAVQIQSNGAIREAMNTSSSGDPQQRMEQAMISHTIAERQAQLRIDTEKLVALAAELKEHVDKTGVNILSMDVIKKAQEIQKLAKSVQDKMKNAY